MSLIITAPSVCAEGAKTGIRICAGVLIPALFPFAVPVLFIINTDTFTGSKHKTDIVFILSLLGGYPIGAKLISELSKEKLIEKEDARKMLLYCVNAGPSFIVLAIGQGVLSSAELGYILLISHIVSALVLYSFLRPKDKPVKIDYRKDLSASDNFVLSVSNASGAVISICAFVILFSVVNGYLSNYSSHLKPLGYLLYLTEVTAASTKTHNIYLISFLLGFAGISIWAQIFSVAKTEKPPLLYFILSRVAHGTLSVVITRIIVSLFKISVPVFSNNSGLYKAYLSSDINLGISLFIMFLLLIIQMRTKKHSGNILKDMI